MEDREGEIWKEESERESEREREREREKTIERGGGVEKEERED